MHWPLPSKMLLPLAASPGGGGATGAGGPPRPCCCANTVLAAKIIAKQKLRNCIATYFMWHLLQLPFDSKDAPPARWHDPQDVIFISAVLWIFGLKFSAVFASCLNSESWQVLQSPLARIT